MISDRTFQRGIRQSLEQSPNVPDHIKSDSGPEFVAKALREQINAVGARPTASNLAAPRKPVTANASPQSSAKNCWMERLSKASRGGIVIGT